MRILNSNYWKGISDEQYISGLKDGNRDITEAFFYGVCNYTLNDIKYSLMRNSVEYDDLVSDLYLYLSVNNWRKLDTFAGLNGCSIRTWIVRVIWRFFMAQHNRNKRGRDDADVERRDDTTNNINLEIAMDVKSTFSRMRNKRYVQILKWMLVEGYGADDVAKMLDTSAANVYNMKHRAIVQFVDVYNAS